MPENLLEVDGLVKRFPLRNGKIVHAVENVSFSLKPGETLALVGESGCGKTTLARTAIRLLRPDSGSIKLLGQEVAGLSGRQLRPHRSAIQMIFQDPSACLNPRWSVGASIAEPLRIEGVDKASIGRRVDAILDLVRLPTAYARRYPHQLSGGQRQRVCIARALISNPKIIVADEATSALDVLVQASIINLLIEIQRNLGVAYIFVSHNLAVVERIAHRVAVMHLGQILEIGPRCEVFANPAHEYTRQLMSAVPIADPSMRREMVLQEGEISSPVWPKGSGPKRIAFHEITPDHLVGA